jgi:CRP-like cAMP-binding protein
MQGVPTEQVRELLSVARRRTLRKGEVVFHRGDPADSLHLISKGRFKVVVMTPLGDQATIAIRGPGDSFGEMAVVAKNTKRSATIEALETAETFAVLDRDFKRLRRTNPGIDELLINFLADEVRLLNERLLEALYVPVEQRVVRRLVELAAIYASGAGTEIPLTQDEIAGLAGASRVTVNQVLNDLQDAEAVALARSRITIRDADVLARRSRPKSG